MYIASLISQRANDFTIVIAAERSEETSGFLEDAPKLDLKGLKRGREAWAHYNLPPRVGAELSDPLPKTGQSLAVAQRAASAISPAMGLVAPH